jgi:molybdenum cofactor cytidylyltransferase
VICGLVVAAGSGTRFGASSSKLLAPLEGRPLLEYAVAAQCAVEELERVVVVLGARAREVLAAVDFERAEPIVFDGWAAGQSASLKFGVAALSGASKVIVTLGDQPLITPALIRRFVGEPGGARAVFGGRPGHPVVLGPRELAALPGLSGDQGARSLLEGPCIECGGVGAIRDVDTPEDLEAIRHEARAVI